MLSYSPWKIEQSSFDASSEPDIDRQLAFSNGYISQYASFEEHYSGKQSAGTWLKGIACALPPVITLSVHLHDELLDLNKWQINAFYRCLHRQQPLLERHFEAVSPTGSHLCVDSRRLLSTDDPRLLSIEYRLVSDNYSGPAAFLALLGETRPSNNWFALERHFNGMQCDVLLQHISEDVQVAIKADFELTRNGEKVSSPLILVDKCYGCGFSITMPVEPGDVVLMKKNVSFGDSVNGM